MFSKKEKVQFILHFHSSSSSYTIWIFYHSSSSWSSTSWNKKKSSIYLLSKSQLIKQK